jgi:hypothetical protein
MNRLITEPDDIRLAFDILFESIILKVDDLDAPLRQFFENLKEYIKRISNANPYDYEFTCREIRIALNLCKSVSSANLNELESLEYVQRTGGYANRGFRYKIKFWDDFKKIKSKIKSELDKQLAL